MIYADTLSRDGIVAGIRRGRVFIDVAGTRDRFLELTAAAGTQTAQMGDTLKVKRGSRLDFKGLVQGAAGGTIEIIFDGRRLPLIKDPHVGSPAQLFEFSWRTDGRPHWIRADVRDATSHLALVGNPIYLR